MLRGVNRQIIEVNDTQNPYFERAIFFVRPDCGEPTDRQLHTQAVDWVATATPATLKTRKRKKYIVSRKALWLMLAVNSAAAAVLGVLCLIR